MRYVKNYVYLYVYIEFCVEAMVDMKKYIKPEIEIVEFDVFDNIAANPGSTLVPPFEDGMELQGDEVFYGIEAGEEGYLIHN